MTDAYRDGDEMLRARAIDLRRDLAELDVRRSEVIDEIATIDRKIKARTRIRRLGVLDDVRIASPCDARWEEMTGDDEVRHCAHCEKNVYALSAMSREKAERVLADHEGDVCVRLHRRIDGTILGADCPVGACRRGVWRTLAVTAGGALSVFTFGAIALLASSHRTWMGMWARSDLQTAASHDHQWRETAKSDAEKLESIVLRWRLDGHPFPECPSLDAMRSNGRLRADEHTSDPWEHSYRIDCAADGDTVVSAGPDGAMDTADDISAGKPGI